MIEKGSVVDGEEFSKNECDTKSLKSLFHFA